MRTIAESSSIGTRPSQGSSGSSRPPLRHSCSTTHDARPARSATSATVPTRTPESLRTGPTAPVPAGCAARERLEPGVVQPGEEVGDGAHRVAGAQPRLRVEVGPGAEHEGPLGGTRVRQGERGVVADRLRGRPRLAVLDEVEVEGARAPADLTGAAEPLLHRV